MSESYRYYAFISYSSKDVAIAKRLQKKMEWYHLPTIIRKEIKREREVEYPKRLSPVFRDMTDLQAGPLGQSLLRELEDSQYLIVICSPRSAQSNWVNRVIENFILMGRYDRIIPCVFDGEGNSKDPEKEAFPPILRRTPIFMDDLPENLKTEEGRQKNEERKARLRELMKGADELEGVSVDQEMERAAGLKTIAKRKRRIQWSLSFAVLLFIAASIGWRIYDRNYRVHVDYFTDYVERWGVPEGIFPLTEEQIKVRNEHYRIETRGGLVRRLIHANSAGTPVPVGNTEFKDRPMIAEYTYDENGMLRAQTWFYTIKPYKGVLGTLIREYDENGNLTKVSFFDRDGKPCLSSDGYAKGTLKYDERGNITEEAYFGTDDKLCLSKNGYAKVTWKYDERGNKTEAAYFGIDDQPCLCSDGYAKMTWKYDEYGKKTEVAYFGTDDKPCLSSEGFAKFTSKYDDQNNLIKKSFFGVDGESVVLAGDDPYVGWEKEFDENGMLRAQTWFYTIKPYKGVLGTLIREYDENGNLTKVSFFDRDGKPCLSSDGYAKATSKYDERGNQTEEAYFGTDDKLCLSKNGYAKGTCKYDERGNITELAFWGTDDKPCLISEGIAKMTCKYDERGKKTEVAYFGTDDQPCLCSHGFAKITLKYDERGKESEKAFWGIDGQSCPGPDGYAKSRINYDEAGNPISMDFYDERNNRLQLYINVNSVVPNMQADKVGIKEGDVFLLYDNKEFDPTGFVNYREQETGDDPHLLIILRDGKKYEVEIKPGIFGANVSAKSVPQELLDEVKNMKAVPLNDSNPETSLPQEVETVPIY